MWIGRLSKILSILKYATCVSLRNLLSVSMESSVNFATEIIYYSAQ